MALKADMHEHQKQISQQQADDAQYESEAAEFNAQNAPKKGESE